MTWSLPVYRYFCRQNWGRGERGWSCNLTQGLAKEPAVLLSDCLSGACGCCYLSLYNLGLITLVIIELTITASTQEECILGELCYRCWLSSLLRYVGVGVSWWAKVELWWTLLLSSGLFLFGVGSVGIIYIYIYIYIYICILCNIMHLL